MGKVCNKCGRELPFNEFYKAETKDGLRGNCKSCHYERSKKWRQENPGRQEELARKWRKENPGRDKENHKRWREANRERDNGNKREWSRNNRDYEIERAKKYRTENREKCSAYGKHWRQQNKEFHLELNKRWRKENPVNYKEMLSRANDKRRLRLKNNNVSYKAVLERDGFVCYLCNKPVKLGELHFDHIVPLSRGGGHKEENISVTHATCNLRKHNKTVEEYFEHTAELTDAKV